MPKIRPSFKRLNYDQWREWQKEAYVGIHEKCDPQPAPDAKGYQYAPAIVVPVYATIRPYSAFDHPAPQVEFWIPKKKPARQNVLSRFRNWLNQ